MLNGDENQLSVPTALALAAHDAGYTRDVIVDTQRPQEIQAAAGPHAIGQFDGWQKAAALRMAVRPDLAGARLGCEVHPVPQRRQHVPRPNGSWVEIKRHGHRLRDPHINAVGVCFFAANPGGDIGLRACSAVVHRRLLHIAARFAAVSVMIGPETPHHNSRFVYPAFICA